MHTCEFICKPKWACYISVNNICVRIEMITIYIYSTVLYKHNHIYMISQHGLENLQTCAHVENVGFM